MRAVLLLEQLRLLLELLVRLLQLLLLLSGAAPRTRAASPPAPRAPRSSCFSSSCCACSSSDWLCSSCVERLRLLRAAPRCACSPGSCSARRRSTPASCSRNVCWISAERRGTRRARSPPSPGSSKSTGSTMMLRGAASPSAGRDLDVVVGRLGEQDRLLLERRLADERLAELEPVRDRLALLVAVASRSGAAPSPSSLVLGDEERAVVRRRRAASARS